MASGGYGRSSGRDWGTGGGGLTSSDSLNEYLNLSESLGVDLPFTLKGAVSLHFDQVEVDFSHPVDPTTGLNVANYSIPGLTLTGAIPHLTDPRSVVLNTSVQVPTTYTLTVSLVVESTGGDLLVSGQNVADFAGVGVAPTFTAAARGTRKVGLTFSEAMLENADLTSPASYSVKTMFGVDVPVASVATAGPSPVSGVELTLGTDLAAGNYYAVTVEAGVKTLAWELSVYPDTQVFVWASDWVAGIPLVVGQGQFSGEVSGGLLGQPLGQIFFSPALETAASSSTLEVDSVSLCTRAYDEYQVPDLPDPRFLTTWSPGQASVLGDVLWAPAWRVGLAQVILHDLRTETMPAAVDGPADATLVETIDITRASFLNDERWKLYDGGGATVFETADNLTPIGPGPTTNINLQP